MCAPHEDDVDDGDDDEADGDRPGGRNARGETGDGDGRERDERHRRALRDEPVRLPRDDPEGGRERQPPQPHGGEQRRSDRAGPREHMCAAGADERDTCTEQRGRDDDPLQPGAPSTVRRARGEHDRGLRRAQDGVRRDQAQRSLRVVAALLGAAASRRIAASSVASVATATAAPCVLALLGFREAEQHRTTQSNR